jgi:hypothetical protein
VRPQVPGNSGPGSLGCASRVGRLSSVALLLATALACWLVPSVASAGNPELSGVLGGQANPLSLQLHLNLKWSQPLSYANEGQPLTKNAHLAAGIAEALTPAYSRTELWGEYSPLSILDLRLGAEVAGYFGNFGYILGFPSYDADVSDEAREARKSEAQAAAAFCLRASPTLKLAFGRLGFRSTADFEWWQLSRPGPYFYEPYRGALLAAGGDGLLSVSTVLVEDVTRSRSGRLQVGLMHELLLVFDAPQNRRQRLGPFLRWQTSDRRWLGVPLPTLFLGIVPYIEGRDRSGFSMFLALGFTPATRVPPRVRP